MWTATRIRQAAIAAIVGGVAWMVTPWVDVFAGTPWAVAPEPVIAALMLVGVLAVHARYGGVYGRLGTAGVALTIVGFALVGIGLAVGIWGYELFLGTAQPDWPGIPFLLGELGIYLGLLLLGIGLYRAEVLSTSRALIFVAALPVAVGFIVLGSMLGSGTVADGLMGFGLTGTAGLCLVVLGYTLRSATGETTTEVSLTSEEEPQAG